MNFVFIVLGTILTVLWVAGAIGGNLFGYDVEVKK